MHNKIEILSDFSEYKQAFLEENAKHNLISKNDEKLLYEKHIYDSLGIKLFFEKYGISKATILDIGCGGGFPCVPIAIEYPELSITGIDSIRKKIASVQTIKEKLNLDNLELIAKRAELTNSKDIMYSGKGIGATINLPALGYYYLVSPNKEIVYETGNLGDY